MAIITGSGFLPGVLISCYIGLSWCPVAVPRTPNQVDVSYSLAPFGGAAVVLSGALLITAIAYFGTFAKTWHRSGILAVAAGFLISGSWIVDFHRIEIHDVHFVVRGPFSPLAATYSLTDGHMVVLRSHQQRQSMFAWRRPQSGRPSSIHFVRADGSETLLHSIGARS